MRKYLIIALLTLFSTGVFAGQNCKAQATKAKVEKCFKAEIVELKEALEEYHEAVLISENIPKPVKEKIDREYISFFKNIGSMCYDLECVRLAMMLHVEDIYEQTNMYTTPRR